MRKVSTIEFVKHVKAGNVKSLLPMIAEKARDTWYKLPHSEQSVRSVRDLIQEGINHTVTHVAPSFDLSRARKMDVHSGEYNLSFMPGHKRSGVKFTTYLSSSLDNFYIDIVREVYAEKRLAPHGLLSLDSSKTTLASGKSVSLLQKIQLTRKTRGDQEMKMINRIDAERAFVRAYTVASPLLRRYMIKWILKPTPGRFKQGVDFDNAQGQFRAIANLLSEELCETIQTDYICRNTIADIVATKFHTHKKKAHTDFAHTEEFAIAGILSQDAICKAMPMIG